MGAVETRESINALTSDNLMIGVPFIEFAFKTGTNVFGSYRQLGIVQSASITKDVEIVSLRSAHSGVDQLVRELVRRFEARLAITVSQFDKKNMQLMFGSASSPAAISGGTTPVEDDPFTLPAYPEWGNLANDIDGTSFDDLDPAPIVGEEVAVSDGIVLEFTLDFKLSTSDIGLSVVLYHDGVDVTSAAGGSLTLDEGTANSGTGNITLDEDNVPAVDSGARIFYHSDDIPAAGVVITADYTPLRALVEDTDFIVDYDLGRVRRVAADATDEFLRADQPMLADYDTIDFTGSTIVPFTQFTFEGRARLKLLTDVGVNIIWPIPLVNLRINDDDFEFSREEFAEGSLTLTLVDDGTATPFGTMQVYEEDAA